MSAALCAGELRGLMDGSPESPDGAGYVTPTNSKAPP